MLSLNNIIIASTVTAATELTIHWNSIQAVSSLSSAGQLMPSLIGLSLVLRVITYIGRVKESCQCQKVREVVMEAVEHVRIAVD